MPRRRRHSHRAHSLPNGKVNGAIVMQRLYQDDLIGHVLEKEDWEVLPILAIATDETIYRVGPEPGEVYRRSEGRCCKPSGILAGTPQDQLWRPISRSG